MIDKVLSLDPSFLQILTCPLHPERGLLRPIATADAGNQRTVIPAALICQNCGRRFPIIHGIVDMVLDGTGEETFRAQEMKQWDEQAARYDQRRQTDLIYQAGVEAAVEALEPSEGDLVLDAGCGTGLTLRRYWRRGIRIVALDLSLESLRYLRKTLHNAPILYVKADVTALPFPPDTFDKTLCANTITHLPSPRLRQACLEELTRVVRRLGRVVVSAHNLSIPKKRAGWEKEGAAKTYSDPVQYIYRYDPEELHQALAVSLQVESVCGAGLPFPYRFKLSWLSRFLERRLRRWPGSAPWGNMVIGVGRKLHADDPAAVESAGTRAPGARVAAEQPGEADERAAFMPRASDKP
jgi:ubiquinone/menaquinone biosynthesis C-methylase UbiE